MDDLIDSEKKKKDDTVDLTRIGLYRLVPKIFECKQIKDMERQIQTN